MPKVQVHSCSVCGKDYLRLFRPYGEFLRVERIRCKQHVPEDEWDWYVPLIEDNDGSVWGLTSVPQAARETWQALPEG